MICPPKPHVEFDEETEQYMANGRWFDTWEEAFGYAEDCVEDWWESRYELERDERILNAE